MQPKWNVIDMKKLLYFKYNIYIPDILCHQDFWNAG